MMDEHDDTRLLPDHHSAVRRLSAEVQGQAYVAFKTLADARRHADAVVVMEGDCGGQIYLTCPVRLIACGEAQLSQLLDDLDSIEWADPSSVGMYYEPLRVGSGVSGGMGARKSSTGSGSIPISRGYPACASRSSGFSREHPPRFRGTRPSVVACSNGSRTPHHGVLVVAG